MSSAPKGHVVAPSAKVNGPCTCECGVTFLGCRPLAMYVMLLEHWAEVTK